MKLWYVGIDGCIDDSLHIFYNEIPVVAPAIFIRNYSQDTLFLSVKRAHYDSTTGVFYAHHENDTLHFYSINSDLYVAPLATDTLYLKSYLPHITEVCAYKGSLARRDYMLKVAKHYTFYYDNPLKHAHKHYKSIHSLVIQKDSSYSIQLRDGEL